jgi:hypothetical protein
MTVILTRKKQFALKEEAVEGTAETLVVADIDMNVEELEMTFSPELQDRRPLRTDLGPLAGVVGVTMGEITGRTELKPGVNATTSPQFDLLLKALGLQKLDVYTYDVTGAATGTFDPGEKVTDGGLAQGIMLATSASTFTIAEIIAFANDDVITGDISGATQTVAAAINRTRVGTAYRPDSTVIHKSFTAMVLHDGLRKQIFGARGDGTLEAAGVGQLGYLTFTLNGAAVAPVDGALFTPSLTEIVPETFVGSTVKVVNGDPAAGSEDVFCVDSFSLALGNTVARRACSDAATGIKSYRITERRPIISIDPEQDLEANIDFMTKLAAGTVFSFSAFIGSSVLKRTQIVAPQVQYQELGNEDREGISAYSAQLLCAAQSTLDDAEFTIAFY